MKKHDAQTTRLRQEKRTERSHSLSGRISLSLGIIMLFFICDDDRFYFVGSQCSI